MSALGEAERKMAISVSTFEDVLISQAFKLSVTPLNTDNLAS